MAYGFRVTNASGVMQIDGSYRNFSFRSKGSRTCTGDAGGATGLKLASVTVTGAVAPMIAIDPGADTVGIWRTSVSGTTWTFYFLGASGATFDYWVFDYYTADPGVTYGLIVRNVSNQVVFHSGAAPLQVKAVGGVGTTSGLPSGRNYAAIQTTPGFYDYYQPELEFMGQFPYRSWTYGVHMPSSTAVSLSVMPFEFYMVGGEGPTTTSPAPQIFIVDVTHL